MNGPIDSLFLIGGALDSAGVAKLVAEVQINMLPLGVVISSSEPENLEGWTISRGFSIDRTQEIVEVAASRFLLGMPSAALSSLLLRKFDADIRPQG
jgi:hypothetical protein